MKMNRSKRKQLLSCLAKRRHPTRDVALDAALRCEGLTGDRLDVYKCPCCLGWHLRKRWRR